MAVEEQITSNYASIVEALKLIVSGGIGAGIVSCIGKLVVDRKLQEQKAEYDKLFNRITKIHEKEFEVLSEAWRKTQDALGYISSLVSLLKTWPDLDGMSDAALEDFLAHSKLREHEKEKLRKSPKKLDYYTKTIFWHELDVTQKAFWDFHNYINYNRIFLSPDLKEQFAKLDKIMWSSIVEKQVSQTSGNMEMWVNAYKQIRDETVPVCEVIENLVQKRLHYQDAD